jgi:hypothetical protein
LLRDEILCVSENAFFDLSGEDNGIDGALLLHSNPLPLATVIANQSANAGVCSSPRRHVKNYLGFVKGLKITSGCTDQIFQYVARAAGRPECLSASPYLNGVQQSHDKAIHSRGARISAPDDSREVVMRIILPLNRTECVFSVWIVKWVADDQ